MSILLKIFEGPLHIPCKCTPPTLRLGPAGYFSMSIKMRLCTYAIISTKISCADRKTMEYERKPDIVYGRSRLVHVYSVDKLFVLVYAYA